MLSMELPQSEAERRQDVKFLRVLCVGLEVFNASGVVFIVAYGGGVIKCRLSCKEKKLSG